MRNDSAGIDAATAKMPAGGTQSSNINSPRDVTTQYQNGADKMILLLIIGLDHRAAAAAVLKRRGFMGEVMMISWRSKESIDSRAAIALTAAF